MHPSTAAWRRRDLLVTLVSLVLMLAWDASGWDLAVTRQFGGAHGFPWRDHPLTSQVLHDGGRGLAAALLLIMAWDALRPLSDGPTALQRRYWLGVILAGLLLVPLMKRFSTTSCPWELAEFGGVARHVPHWWLGVSGGGAGHCFPSGHAVAAFAFFGGFFLWRAHRPRLARALLVAIVLLGAAYGAAQMVRGAHFVSHTLWSAWLCWTLAVLAQEFALRHERLWQVTRSD